VDSVAPQPKKLKKKSSRFASGRCSVQTWAGTLAMPNGDFNGFPQFTQENSGIIPPLGHDCFISNLFQLIIISHPTTRCSGSCRPTDVQLKLRRQLTPQDCVNMFRAYCHLFTRSCRFAFLGFANLFRSLYHRLVGLLTCVLS
jgi:hypothetical protein